MAHEPFVIVAESQTMLVAERDSIFLIGGVEGIRVYEPLFLFFRGHQVVEISFHSDSTEGTSRN